MKTTYRVLAYLVMILVALQAAGIAFAFFGLGSWIESGNDMTKAVMESGSSGMTGEVGLILHSILGMYAIPLIALVMLVLSFFARIHGGSKWAAFILVDTVVQVLLGLFAFGMASLGILHGLNAFLLFWLALMAVRATEHSAERADAPVGVRVQ